MIDRFRPLDERLADLKLDSLDWRTQRMIDRLKALNETIQALRRAEQAGLASVPSSGEYLGAVSDADRREGLSMNLLRLRDRYEEEYRRSRQDLEDHLREP